MVEAFETFGSSLVLGLQNNRFPEKHNIKVVALVRFVATLAIVDKAIRSIVSWSVTPEQLSVTFETFSMITVIATTMSLLPAGWLYGVTIETMPSVLFYVTSLSDSVAFVLLVFLYIK
ncbi:hypothetical protein BGZ46_009000 [Entomortierella lignicola]|nr:hypothetical protein BGZ46_009000 [Entomortierella lignicola]